MCRNYVVLNFEPRNSSNYVTSFDKVFVSDVRSFLHTQIKESLLHTSARHGNEEGEGKGGGLCSKVGGLCRMAAAAADVAAGPPRPN